MVQTTNQCNKNSKDFKITLEPLQSTKRVEAESKKKRRSSKIVCRSKIKIEAMKHICQIHAEKLLGAYGDTIHLNDKLHLDRDVSNDAL